MNVSEQGKAWTQNQGSGRKEAGNISKATISVIFNTGQLVSDLLHSKK